MPNCNGNKRRKGVGFLLIAVFSLLQLSLWGPSFSRAFPEKVGTTCYGDHKLCGCAPSRIASGTCCCSLKSISPCCQKNYIQSAEEEKAALGTVITSLPCGGSEDPLVSASIEAYLLLGSRICDCPVTPTVYKTVSAINQLEHHIIPPVPPPRT